MRMRKKIRDMRGEKKKVMKKRRKDGRSFLKMEKRGKFKNLNEEKVDQMW